jgi:hypothetical protein
MSADRNITDLESGLEARARSLLLERVDRTDARVRSRLNQARQAAVMAAQSPQPWWYRWFNVHNRWMVMPAAASGVVCALALVLVFTHTHTTTPSALRLPDGARSLEVLDLVTDDDVLGLVESEDSGFYEWAAAQGDVVALPVSSGGGA